MKQINVFWLKIIKKLREMISELDNMKSKRGDLLFKLVDLTKDLNSPNLLMDTILLSKEKSLEQLEVLKVPWASEFIDSIEFFEEEVLSFNVVIRLSSIYKRIQCVSKTTA
jgi:hypothetical protein